MMNPRLTIQPEIFGCLLAPSPLEDRGFHHPRGRAAFFSYAVPTMQTTLNLSTQPAALNRLERIANNLKSLLPAKVPPLVVPVITDAVREVEAIRAELAALLTQRIDVHAVANGDKEPRPRDFQEVLTFAHRIGLPDSEAEKFWLHYQTNGWRAGRVGMKSWHMGMWKWKKNWQEGLYNRPAPGMASSPPAALLAEREIRQLERISRAL